ncbi:hypothetical protein DFJ77DRAFT_457963 [Powellomyces hirtus]|nr:hypothetical protein DFJ77DRAFT_457963 [Powellomyces hirtus]
MCKTDHPNLSQFRILQLCDVLPAVYDRQKKYLSDVEQMIATYPTLHNLWANRKTIPFVVRGRPTIAAQIIPAKSWCREYDRVCALEHAPNDSDDSLLEVVPKRHRVASRVRKFEARRDLDDPPFDVAPPPPRASSREREIQARRDLNETPRYVPSRVRETQGREDSDDSSKDVEPKRRRVGSGERDFNISGSVRTLCAATSQSDLKPKLGARKL